MVIAPLSKTHPGHVSIALKKVTNKLPTFACRWQPLIYDSWRALFVMPVHIGPKFEVDS